MGGPALLNPLVREYVLKHVNESISKSKIYDESVKSLDVYQKNNYNHPKIMLVDIDSTGAVLKYCKELNGTNAILNFASFIHPGGGCLFGAHAQEEELCYESNLYYIISHFNDFYSENKKTYMNRDLYTNRGIYSPDVLFARLNNNYNKDSVYDASSMLDKAYCDVITVAAPFSKKARASRKATYDECYSIMDSRVKFSLDIAEDNHVDNLILGAFGCGKFENDPYDVASMFDRAIRNNDYHFKNIIFAIPDTNSLNYKQFSRFFKPTSITESTNILQEANTKKNQSQSKEHKIVNSNLIVDLSDRQIPDVIRIAKNEVKK